MILLKKIKIIVFNIESDFDEEDGHHSQINKLRFSNLLRCKAIIKSI